MRESIDYQPFQNTIEKLLSAIRLYRVCEVRFLTASGGEEKACFFAPQKLITRNNALHARGWTIVPSGMASPLNDEPAEIPVHLITQLFPTQRGAEHLPNVDESREGMEFMEEEW